MYKQIRYQWIIALLIIFLSPLAYAGDATMIFQENTLPEYLSNPDVKYATGQKDADVDELVKSLGFEVEHPYKKAPDFTYPDIDGNSVIFSELPGALIVFNMWAKWCPPCQKEKPLLQKFYEEMAPENFSLITAHYTGTDEDVKKYMDEHGYTFNVILDKTGEKIGIPFGIKYLPTTFLVDRDGYIRGKKIGKFKWDCPQNIATFKEIIDELD